MLSRFFAFIRKIFGRKEINPYSVSDKVTFRNVDKTLTLYVRAADVAPIVVGLKNAQERLKGLTNETPEDKRTAATLAFAGAIFGADQARQLLDFYGEPLTVLTVCGQYFKERLGKKITKAQKR